MEIIYRLFRPDFQRCAFHSVRLINYVRNLLVHQWPSARWKDIVEFIAGLIAYRYPLQGVHLRAKN